MRKYKRGLTTGVYDMFHVGHLNILKNAKKFCKYLVVGVSSDEVVKTSKNKNPIIPYENRAEIVRSIKYVDEVFEQKSYSLQEKISNVLKYDCDVLFVGSDWKGTKKWEIIEGELAKYKVSVVYLPHTDGISSSILRETISKNGND